MLQEQIKPPRGGESFLSIDPGGSTCVLTNFYFLYKTFHLGVVPKDVLISNKNVKPVGSTCVHTNFYFLYKTYGFTNL